ncbi:MAG: shikimate dehydrogenase [Armatimonadota bacterium]
MNGHITGKTRVVGLFGHPVQHSCSPAIHNAAFKELGLNFIYVPFDVHPDDLAAAVHGIKAMGIVGVNVTIPHKNHAGEYLDWVSDDARMIGSVNTIHNDDGVLKGYSTDGQGFIKALESAGKSPAGSNAVVMGAGGAARATVYALVKAGASVTIINRTHERAVDLAESLNKISGIEPVRSVKLDENAKDAIVCADLLVNCTSVGMYPNIDASPVPKEWLHPGLFVFDQVYNPAETTLLREAKSAGAQGVNGLRMLIFQGALSFEIWTGIAPPIDVMESVV